MIHTCTCSIFYILGPNTLNLLEKKLRKLLIHINCGKYVNKYSWYFDKIKNCISVTEKQS
jgi:hypothetical protein